MINSDFYTIFYRGTLESVSQNFKDRNCQHICVLNLTTLNLFQLGLYIINTMNVIYKVHEFNMLCFTNCTNDDILCISFYQKSMETIKLDDYPIPLGLLNDSDVQPK